MTHISRTFMRNTIADLSLEIAALKKSVQSSRHALMHARGAVEERRRGTALHIYMITALKNALVQAIGAEAADKFLNEAWDGAEETVRYKRARRSSKKTRKVSKRIRTSTTVRTKRATASA